MKTLSRTMKKPKHKSRECLYRMFWHHRHHRHHHHRHRQTQAMALPMGMSSQAITPAFAAARAVSHGLVMMRAAVRRVREVARVGRKVRVILLVWCTGGLVVGVSRKGRPQQVLVKRVVRMCVVRSLRMGVV